MLLEDFVIGTTIFLAIATLFAAIWLANVLVQLGFLVYIHRRFKKFLKGSITHNQPKWDQVCEVAESFGVTKQRAIMIVTFVLSDVLAGTVIDDESKSKRTLLESYITAYRLSEPFEGLPNETRLYLDRLRKELGTNTEALHPLTSHIRELLKGRDATNRRQRFYTSGGFLVGVLGLVYAMGSVSPLDLVAKVLPNHESSLPTDHKGNER